MYLVKDITGPASGREYGKSGDEVFIHPCDGWREMVRVENKQGDLFYVWPEDLSEKPIYDNEIKKDSQPSEVVKKGAGRVQQIHKVKRRR